MHLTCILLTISFTEIIEEGILDGRVEQYQLQLTSKNVPHHIPDNILQGGFVDGVIAPVKLEITLKRPKRIRGFTTKGNIWHDSYIRKLRVLLHTTSGWVNASSASNEQEVSACVHGPFWCTTRTESPKL